MKERLLFTAKTTFCWKICIIIDLFHNPELLFSLLITFFFLNSGFVNGTHFSSFQVSSIPFFNTSLSTLLIIFSFHFFPFLILYIDFFRLVFNLKVKLQWKHRFLVDH